MADKRAFKTLVASMERKAKDLSEYIEKSDSNDRVAKSKHEKLSKDMNTLEEIINRVVASADGAMDDMVKKQEEITEKVEIALEGAEEFIALKEFENDMQNKELDVQSVHLSVGCKMDKIKAQITEKKNSRDGLSKQAEAVLSVELTNLENSIKDAIAKNNFLILKDVKNKARYQD